MMYFLKDRCGKYHALTLLPLHVGGKGTVYEYVSFKLDVAYSGAALSHLLLDGTAIQSPEVWTGYDDLVFEAMDAPSN